MNATFDTSKYEHAHGKKPRGYGLWCFSCRGTPVVAFTCTYSGAKKLVKQARPDNWHFELLP